jgi:hypothetical protein
MKKLSSLERKYRRRRRLKEERRKWNINNLWRKYIEEKMIWNKYNREKENSLKRETNIWLNVSVMKYYLCERGLLKRRRENWLWYRRRWYASIILKKKSEIPSILWKPPLWKYIIYKSKRRETSDISEKRRREISKKRKKMMKRKPKRKQPGAKAK